MGKNFTFYRRQRNIYILKKIKQKLLANKKPVFDELKKKKRKYCQI